MRRRLAKVQEQPQVQHQPEAQPELPSDEMLRAMISEAAYYRAEKRGFAPGLEADDWLQAETEVLARMRAGEARI